MQGSTYAPSSPSTPSDEVAEVAVVLEQRFDRSPDGRVWTPGPSSYPFWVRYLEVFDRVRVVARIRDVAAPEHDWREVSGPGVEFAPVPHYLGPWEYLRNRGDVHRALKGGLPARSAVIMRAGSALGSVLQQHLDHEGRPYAVEVVTDPHDVFGPGAVAHPLRAFFRRLFVLRLRRECAGAVAVSYVTQEALQRRYPGGPDTYTVACSDVELPDAAFVAGPRAGSSSGTFVVVAVGSLEQRYKGFDVLVDAIARCAGVGIDLRLVVLGDGRHKEELRVQADSLGVAHRVELVGWVASSSEVRQHLDAADLFVLPSRADGLPRAVVEAMARGLPCLGSRVGGIPELLADEDLVPPDDAAALASSLEAVYRSPARRSAMSKRNWTKAKTEFHEDVLQARRRAFHRVVHERTESWLMARTSPLGSGLTPGFGGGRKIYVTGASGFVGLHLLQALLESSADSEVIAVHRRDLQQPPVSDPRIKWVQRDIVRDSLVEDMQGVDCVFHLAASVSFKTDAETLETLESVNVLGTRRVAEAALGGGVRKFIYVSSIAACEEAVAGDVVSESTGVARSDYGKSKLGGEQELAEVAAGGLNYLIFRPTALFGEDHTGSVFELVRVLDRRRYVQIGDGENATNFLYVKDFVNVLLQGAASDLRNEVFIVNHARQSLRELTDMICASLERRRVPFYVPRRAGVALGAVADLARRASVMDLPISVRRVQAICRSTYYSPDKLYADRAFSETYGLRQGLSNTIQWFKSSGLL